MTVNSLVHVFAGAFVLIALALGAEPPAPDTMTHPPRARGTPLLDFGLLARAFLVLGTTEAQLKPPGPGTTPLPPTPAEVKKTEAQASKELAARGAQANGLDGEVEQVARGARGAAY